MSTVKQMQRQGSFDSSMPVSSPALRRFRMGKDRVLELFSQLTHQLAATGLLLADQTATVLTQSCPVNHQMLKEQTEQVKALTDALSREYMKVVFVGQTSNGKSTVINAMLHNRVLPTGWGHTTSCFLSVEGGDTNSPYLLRNGSDVQCSVDSVKQLASALVEGSENEQQLIRVVWPSSQTKLLGDDVRLVDSPGLDLSSNVDEWIDKYCMDADVFVLVCNAESTLKQTERQFFTKVSEKLSKPNVFILNNRWDSSDNDMDEATKLAVRTQHTNNAAKFLVDNLQVVQKQDLQDRIFFVSAKEMLRHRCEKTENPKPRDPAEEERYQDFKRFENLFEQRISSSALQTRFDHRVRKAVDIAKFLHDTLQSLKGVSEADLRTRNAALLVGRGRVERIHLHSQKVLDECVADIAAVGEQAIRDVSTTLKDESAHARIEEVISRFDDPLMRHKKRIPFGDGDGEHVREYVQRLSLHLSDKLRLYLQQHLAKELHERCNAAKKRMRLRFRETLSLEDSPKSRLARTKQDLEAVEVFLKDFENFAAQEVNVDFTPDCCATLSHGFVPDLKFKFRLGFSRIAPVFHKVVSVFTVGLFTMQAVSGGLNYFTQPASAPASAPTTPAISAENSTDEKTVVKPKAVEPDVGLIDRMTLLMKRHPQQTILGVFGVSVVARPSIWRGIGFAVLGFGALYYIERAMYTEASRERRLKDQFSAHAKSIIDCNAPATAASIAGIFRRDLTTSLEYLRIGAQEARRHMEEELRDIESAVSRDTAACRRCQELEHEVAKIHAGFQDFLDTYVNKSGGADDVLVHGK